MDSVRADASRAASPSPSSSPSSSCLNSRAAVFSAWARRAAFSSSSAAAPSEASAAAAAAAAGDGVAVAAAAAAALLSARFAASRSLLWRVARAVLACPGRLGSNSMVSMPQW